MSLCQLCVNIIIMNIVMSQPALIIMISRAVAVNSVIVILWPCKQSIQDLLNVLWYSHANTCSKASGAITHVHVWTCSKPSDMLSHDLAPRPRMLLPMTFSDAITHVHVWTCSKPSDMLSHDLAPRPIIYM